MYLHFDPVKDIIAPISARSPGWMLLDPLIWKGNFAWCAFRPNSIKKDIYLICMAFEKARCNAWSGGCIIWISASIQLDWPKSGESSCITETSIDWNWPYIQDLIIEGYHWEIRNNKYIIYDIKYNMISIWSKIPH